MALPTVAQVAMPVIKKTLGQRLLTGIGKLATNKLVGTIGAAALQHRHNKKLAQYSFDRNVEMWKMQNEYNSPAQQMARFKSAGLNPQMIYDKGTAGNAQTMPQYQQLPTSGDVYGQSVAGLQGIVEIGKKRQELAILEIDKKFKLDTLEARTATQTYTELIKRIEYQQELYGVRGQAAYQMLFQHMNNNTLMSADEMYKVIALVKGSEVAMQALKNLGLGFLINKRVKK